MVPIIAAISAISSVGSVISGAKSLWNYFHPSSGSTAAAKPSPGAVQFAAMMRASGAVVLTKIEAAASSLQAAASARAADAHRLLNTVA